MCELRFARLIMSGPPPKEPKGGVPCVTCARVEKQHTKIRMKPMYRRLDLVFFMAHPLGVSLERKRRQLDLNSTSQTEPSSRTAHCHSAAVGSGTAPERRSRLDNLRNRFRRAGS